VPRNATRDELRHAYHALAHRHHPDHAGDPARFRAVVDAYATLSSAAERARYDATLDPQPERRPAPLHGTELVPRPRPAASAPPTASPWRRVLALEAYAPRPRPQPLFVDVVAY
jgi:curved DNA-binding protein CbpA